MNAPIAATAERPRIIRVAPEPAAQEVAPTSMSDRRTTRVERRHARRQRRLGAAIGIGVLCVFLVATVLVLDAVR
jgi:hypothetical protein